VIYIVLNKYSAFFGFTLGLGLSILQKLKPIVEGNNRIGWVHISKTWFDLLPIPYVIQVS
jgi:hypothetical protein